LGYVVFRKDPREPVEYPYVRIARLPPDATSYRDRAPDETGRVHFIYRVVAYVDRVFSDYAQDDITPGDSGGPVVTGVPLRPRRLRMR
jgi:hypothetical protein